MTIDRVVFGQMGGKYGLYVSKPGIDVKAASLLQLAFSTDHTLPRLIGRGQLLVAPNPSGNPGTVPASGSVSFGGSYNPYPFVAAMVKAADWTLMLNGAAGGGAQLQYLNNKFATWIYEQPSRGNAGYPAGQTSVYGPMIQRCVTVDCTFASARFTMSINNTSVTFTVNNRNTVLIKYIILEP